MVIIVTVRQANTLNTLNYVKPNTAVLQVNLFLDRLQGDPIGFSVLGIFVIGKNTILTVRNVYTQTNCVIVVSFFCIAQTTNLWAFRLILYIVRHIGSLPE